MRVSVLVSFLAGTALAKKLADPGKLDCPPGGGAHIIAQSGHGGLPHTVGLLQSLQDGILKAIPGSNNYSTPYPKKDDNKPQGIAQGVTMLTKNIKAYAKKCVGTPIILIGYSEGAIVTSNTLCGRSHKGAPFSKGLAGKYNKVIIASTFYGDETFIPGQPYNRGTCKKGHGVDPRQNPAGCKPFENNMRSWCDKPDPECCMGHKNFTHFKYPDKYNPEAIKFVVNNYNNYVKHHGMSPPTPPSGGGSGGSGGKGGKGGSGGGMGGKGGSGGSGSSGGSKGGKGGKGGKGSKGGKGGKGKGGKGGKGSKGGKGGKGKHGKCHKGLLGGLLGGKKCHKGHKGHGGHGGGGGGSL